MLRELWRRPSIVLGTWIVLFVGVFAWCGAFGLAAEVDPVAPVRHDPPPVVVHAEPSARPRAEHVVVVGRVFDAQGFLLVGADVLPMHKDALRTDADGSFRLELEANGVADVLVRAAGQQPKWWRVAAGSPDAQVVQLEPQAPWDGAAALLPPLPQIRGEGAARTADGRPLADAFVTALGTGIWVRTDTFGRFTAPLSTPVASLFVHRPDANGSGFAHRAEPISTARAHGGLMPAPDLVAEPAATISGIVRSATGEALVGVPVRVVGDAIERVVETGADGGFRVSGLLPGKFRVAPFAFRGSLGRAVDVTLDRAVVACDVGLAAMTDARLRVVDDRGAAVAGALVAVAAEGVRRAVAAADAGGYVTLPIAAEAAFEVRAPETFAALPVQRLDLDGGVLVVAAATAGR